MSGYKRISKEIKDEVIKRARDGVKVSDLAVQYGISTKSIYNWLSQGVHAAVSWSEHARVKKQNEELLRIIGLLTHQNTKLKKKTDTRPGGHYGFS
jgi:transposase-like protein